MSSRISFKGKAKIVNEEYVLKEKNRDIKYLYDYLSSRDFYGYPDLIDESIDSYKFKYIKNNNNTKIEDVLLIMASLHSKTSYYKKIDDKLRNDIYKKIKDNILYTEKYYLDLTGRIEEKDYYSPSEYLLLRNISIIFSLLKYSLETLEKWFKYSKDKEETRIVLVHNNIKKEHVLTNSESYLISFDNYIKDSAIIDIYKFYRNENYDINILRKLDVYESVFKLNEEENLLLNVFISLPIKLSLKESELSNLKHLRNHINNIYEIDKIIKNRSNLLPK